MKNEEEIRNAIVSIERWLKKDANKTADAEVCTAWGIAYGLQWVLGKRSECDAFMKMTLAKSRTPERHER